jgi:hypothetical protein
MNELLLDDFSLLQFLFFGDCLTSNDEPGKPPE